jgi:uncharacterized repeat protein (TIGR01451 family)
MQGPCARLSKDQQKLQLDRSWLQARRRVGKVEPIIRARAHGRLQGATRRAVRRHAAKSGSGQVMWRMLQGAENTARSGFWREFIIDTKNSRACGAQVRRWAVGAWALAAGALLAGCNFTGPDDRPELPLKATSTDVQTPVMRGAQTTFTTTLTNPSSKAVNLVTLWDMLDERTSYVSATCTAQGGAVCPDVSTSTWAPVDMPAGSSLTFGVTVLVDFLAVGTIQNHFYAANDTYRGSAETFVTRPVAGDTRSGDYQAYWRTGQLTDASFDFMKGSFLPGNGNAYVFTVADDGLLQMDGNARFWAPPDLVVGTADNGQGPEPFVAARRFVETVAELEGVSFNVLGSVLVFGMPLSEGYPAWVEGGMLNTCDSMQYSAQTCPPGSLHHYTLTVNGSEFSAEVTPDISMHFRVAKSGSSLIFLRVGDGDQVNGLQIGMQVNDGPANVGAFGVSTRGDWGFMSLSSDSYAADWTPLAGGTLHETATLSALPGANPGVMTGRRSSDGAVIHLSVGGALGVAIGAADGAANGELQLFTPF